MHYADTTTDDTTGAVVAFCYCGWSDEHATQEAADAAAERHQNNPPDEPADD